MYLYYSDCKEDARICHYNSWSFHFHQDLLARSGLLSVPLKHKNTRGQCNRCRQNADTETKSTFSTCFIASPCIFLY